MTNKDFIEKYGKKEFVDICNYICIELSLTRIQRKIGNFKINNSKKYATFYRKDGKHIRVEMATIYSIGVDNLSKYVEKM